MDMLDWKKRLKNKAFLLALSSIAYQVVAKYVGINEGDYQLIVDLITYSLIGIGIYHDFSDTDGEA